MIGLGTLITEVNFTDSQLASGLITQVVQPILIPMNEQIQRLIDKRQNEEKGFLAFSDQDIREVSDSLQLLGDFWSSLHGLSSQTTKGAVNPMLPVFAELWPFIDRVLTEFVHFDEICEAVIRVVKHSLRVLGE